MNYFKKGFVILLVVSLVGCSSMVSSKSPNAEWKLPKEQSIKQTRPANSSNKQTAKVSATHSHEDYVSMTLEFLVCISIFALAA